MKPKVILTALALVIAVAMSTHALLGKQDLEGRIPSAKPTLTTAVNGQAYSISLIGADPVAESVTTLHPVLHYAGFAVGDQLMAYIPLEVFDETAPEGRRPVAFDERGDNFSELVPSGDLYIEDTRTGKTRRVDDGSHYVITAAWAPDHESLIAYTFSSGSAFGVALANVRTSSVEVIRSEGVLADYLSWGPAGTLHFYEVVPGRMFVDSSGYSLPLFRETAVAPDSRRSTGRSLEIRSALPQAALAPSFEEGEQPLYIGVGSSTLVRARNIAGVGELEVLDATGSVVQRTPADVLVGALDTGVVYKVASDEGMELKYLSNNGEVTTLVGAAAATVFVLPIHGASSSPDMTVTQVGTGFSTQCSVSSHTGVRKYAYDMQTAAGNDFVLAASSGTVSYIERNITCNSVDTDCPDYRSPCQSNSGYGNTVIIQHADGTYTEYSHLRHGTIAPPSTGRAVGLGCGLGREGHTGATCCIKNQCGDHLHFQRQSGSLPTSSSISIAFAGQTNPLRCQAYNSSTGGRSCVFLSE